MATTMDDPMIVRAGGLCMGLCAAAQRRLTVTTTRYAAREALLEKMAYRRVAAPYGDYRSPIHLSLDPHKYPVYI